MSRTSEHAAWMASRRYWRVKLLRGGFGYGPARKGKLAVVRTDMNGEHHLSITPSSVCFKVSAMQGRDFEYTCDPPEQVTAES